MDEPARSSPLSNAPRMRLVSGALTPGADPSVDSYRRLADVFHDLLSEQSLDSLLVRIADTLDEIVPYEALHIYEADEPKRELVPALVRSEYADEILSERFPFGEGITGWAVEHREPVLANQAHLDPRVRFVPGTPLEPEALIVVPLVARGALKGTLNVYRIGEDALVQRRGVRARQAARRRRRARARQRAHPSAARARGADRLAHRPLQPPPLPRAPPARADPRLERARERRRGDARHRRLQEGERRLRPRRRRPGARRARRPPAGDRPLHRRRLPDRRRGVRGDRAVEPRGPRGRAGQPARAAAGGRRARPRRPDRRLDRDRPGPRARREPARARRLRRGRDDDREGARQEPGRLLRRLGDRAPGAARQPRRGHPLDRAPEDAPVARAAS